MSGLYHHKQNVCAAWSERRMASMEENYAIGTESDVQHRALVNKRKSTHCS